MIRICIKHLCGLFFLGSRLGTQTKSRTFTSGEPRLKILLLVFMSEIKIDLTLKKSNFLFLLCFKNAIIKFIPMHQRLRQRNSFFSSHFTSNLMLPACLMGMILVVKEVCNSKIA